MTESTERVVHNWDTQYRDTYFATCGKVGSHLELATRWKAVTCPDCLAYKPEAATEWVHHWEPVEAPLIKRTEHWSKETRERFTWLLLCMRLHATESKGWWFVTHEHLPWVYSFRESQHDMLTIRRTVIEDFLAYLDAGASKTEGAS